jgi:Short C-terminal domain
VSELEAPRPQTWRLVVARILVVLGVLLLVVTILASYIRYQAFDDDTFDETASELIANDAVRSQVAAASVEALFNNVDVQASLEERLPPDQQRLAGPITAGLRELADRIAAEMLERPRIQALWRESVHVAHDELVAILRNETRVFRVQDKAVVLDLRPLILRLGERLAFVSNLADQLPEDAGVVRVMDADQLDRAQDITSLFENVAAWIWVVPLLLWAIAIWLARGRRRIEVRAIAIGIVVAGVLVLVVRSLAGDYVVDNLVTTTSVKDAAGQAWDIVTDLLADGAWSAIAVGMVALVGVWLAGPRSSGTAARRWLAPVLARPGLTYGILALLLLLFIWWGPFAQARRPLYLTVTGLLLVAGVEVLRRATVREFPDAAATEPRELLRPLARLRPGHGSGVATPAPSTPATPTPSTPETSLDQLERLAALHQQGVLSDEELAAAKARILG